MRRGGTEAEQAGKPQAAVSLEAVVFGVFGMHVFQKLAHACAPIFHPLGLILKPRCEIMRSVRDRVKLQVVQDDMDTVNARLVPPKARVI